MSKKTPSPTIVVTDTDRLAAVADAILALAGNPKLSKNTILNSMAKTLTGQNTNWGGLKAREDIQFSGPRDEDLRSMLLPAQDTVDKETAAEKTPAGTPQNFWIEGNKIVFLFDLAQPGRAPIHLPIPLPLIELPALWSTLSSSGKSYTSKDLTFRVDGGTLRISHQPPAQATTVIEISTMAFVQFLKENSGLVEQTIVEETEVGRIVHAAFELVSENQGADLLWEAAGQVPQMEMTVHHEGEKANQERIFHACREATILYLEAAARDKDTRWTIRGANRDALVNHVFQDKWGLLYEAMINDLERSDPVPADKP